LNSDLLLLLLFIAYGGLAVCDSKFNQMCTSPGFCKVTERYLIFKNCDVTVRVHGSSWLHHHYQVWQETHQ